MKYVAYNKMYHAYRGKGKKKFLYVLGGVLAVIAALLLAAWLVFRQELAVAGTVRPLDGSPAYFMEVKGDYHFEEFLAQGGASSDMEVSVFLSKKISKGFYTASVGEFREGCSVLSARSAEGSHLWGRNYDWMSSVPIILRHVPKDGYASLSTCDFRNITGNSQTLPEGMMNRMMAIAALYVPLDGINEAGLCVADLEVNEGGMPDPDTEKPDLTVTTAIRLLLDRAATVDEALALLEQYDIHPSGGISHHLAISDAACNSVCVEFTEDGFTAVPTQAVTNFNMAVGNAAAGGASSQERYKLLLESIGFDVSQWSYVRSAMRLVAQDESGSYPTQWAVIYDQAFPYVTWYFGGDFEKGVTLPILPDGNGR